MWHHDGHHFWGMHWVWWVLLIIFLIWIFAMLWGGSSQRIKKETPLDILEKRYAAGEIDSEEFQEKKKDLKN